jgi:hypothetical protein
VHRHVMASGGGVAVANVGVVILQAGVGCDHVALS